MISCILHMYFWIVKIYKKTIIISYQIVTENKIFVDDFSINKKIFEYDVIVMLTCKVSLCSKKSNDIEVHVTLNSFIYDDEKFIILDDLDLFDNSI